MKCIICGSDKVTKKTETTTSTTTLIGFFWKKTEHNEDTKITYECNDCGHKWEEQ